MNFDSYKSLAFRRDGRVLHASFNRPDSLNAFDAALHDDFERFMLRGAARRRHARDRAQRRGQGLQRRRRHRAHAAR